jgi:hypothetical protein
MNTAAKMTNGTDDVTQEVFWKKSLKSLNAGIRAFEAVDDRYWTRYMLLELNLV